MSASTNARRSRSKLRRSAAASCEPLERRVLLAITWGNRGSAGNDSDGLNALFGVNAALARDHIDRAIFDWNRVILNFNYSGHPNSYNLNFLTAPITSIAAAQITGQVGGKPTEATIRIQNIAATHWLDPTPLDDAEFTDVKNAFTGWVPGTVFGNPTDLYATALHEIGHAMGIANDPNLLITNFLTDTGLDDPNDSNPNGGNLFSLNIGGGSIEATVTNADPGHLWEGPRVGVNPAPYVGLPWHPEILMNSGRAIFPQERNLISDFEANLLAQIYGYTIALPSTINNMLVRQTFPNGVLTIVGQPGNVNDLIVIERGATDHIRVTVGTVGGGASFTESLLVTQVGSIVASGNDGNDILRLEYNGGRATTLNGGNGNDFVDFSFGTKLLADITGNTVVNGGSDNDAVFVYDNNSVINQTFSITSARFDRDGWGGFDYASNIESFTLTTGTAADTVNVLSTFSGQPVVLGSAGGADVVNVGNALNGARDLSADVTIQNDPNFTLININNGPDTTPRNVVIDQWAGNLGAIAGLTPAFIIWDRADVNALTITTGQGTDSISVLRTSEAITFYNPAGCDSLTVGNNINGMQSITGGINVGPNGGLVFTDIHLNDSANPAGRTTLWTKTPAIGGYTISGLAPASITYVYQSAILLEVLGGGGADSYSFVGIDDDWAQTHINGGGGLNTLNVDDAGSPYAATVAEIFPGSIHRGIGIAVGALDIFFSNIQLPRFFARSSTTAFEIHGVSSSVSAGDSMIIGGSSGADTFNIYPRDQFGILTINGNLTINGSGGSDTILFSTASSALPMNYVMAGGTVTGAGSGSVFTAGNELLAFSAGSGSDTWTTISGPSSNPPMTIFGGPGTDTFNFEVTLTPAAVTFNGGDGIDTLNLNDAANTSFQTTWNVTATTLTRRRDDNLLTRTYTHSEVEQFNVTGSAGVELFYVDGLSSGTMLAFNAGASLDGLLLGYGANTVGNIFGGIVYNAGPGGGNMGVIDSADTTGDVVHIDANSMGAYAGDNLFGAGGWLQFSDLVNFGVNPGLTLNLGSGADTVYVQPLATARVTVNAGNPAAAPGDSLKLALAAAQNPVVSGTSANGSVTSTDHHTVNWTGFEGSIATDAIAPSVLAADINLNGLPGFTDAAGNRQALDVQFSENVSGRLNPSWLQLNNLTTSQSIPASSIAVEYDLGSNTAHFTFPGYANGVLPDGDYSGKILAGLPDFFGNGLPADAPFSFFFLQGDANHDRRVNLADFNILAGNFGGSNKTFSQGDFNYDGTVNLQDFNILAGRFSASLAQGLMTRSALPFCDLSTVAGPSGQADRVIEMLDELDETA